MRKKKVVPIAEPMGVVTASLLKDLVEYSPTDAVLEVDRLYREHYGPKLLQRERAGYADRRRIDDWLNNLITATFVTLAVSAITGGLIFLCLKDGRAHEAELKACQSGNAIGCIEAVQDQRTRQCLGGDARAKLLLRAYKLRTGQELDMPK